jgi:hypothetical protein
MAGVHSEALVLAKMYYDDATPNREQVLKLLKVGFLERQRLVSRHLEISAHKKRLLGSAQPAVGLPAVAEKRQKVESKGAARKRSKC